MHYMGLSVVLPQGQLYGVPSWPAPHGPWPALTSAPAVVAGDHFWDISGPPPSSPVHRAPACLLPQDPLDVAGPSARAPGSGAGVRVDAMCFTQVDTVMTVMGKKGEAGAGRVSLGWDHLNKVGGLGLWATGWPIVVWHLVLAGV